MLTASLIAASLLSASSPAVVGQAPLKHLTLLQIADSHAQLETHPEFMPGEDPPYPRMGGYARLKTAVDRAKADASGPTFFVDSGDTFQGSAAGAWSQGEAIVAPLNNLGLDAFVPGNWEVVYGPEQFRKLMLELTSKVLVYNLQDATTGQRLFPPAAILEKGGVRVAFIGITDPTTTQRQPPAEVRGLDTTHLEGLRTFVQDLKAREHPDLVVAFTHTGLTVSRKLAHDIPEFDVVLSGHTHERTFQPIIIGKTIVVEPGSMGSFLGRLDLTLAPGGGVQSEEYRLIPVRASVFPEDPQEKQIIDTAEAPYRARMGVVVGKTKTPVARYDVLETTADDFVSDAVREMSHADIGSTNGFRFSPPLLPGDLTEGDLWSLLPLDARVKMGWITGRQLRAYLENELELVFSKDAAKLSGGWGPRLSGVEMTFMARNAPGHRLRSLTVGGKAVEDDRHYVFAGCERAGEAQDIVCRLPGVHDVKILPLSIHQILDSYLKRHAVIAPRIDRREVALDLPERVFSQDYIFTEQTGDE